MKTVPSRPAFPAIEFFDEKPVGSYEGLTKREYFAARAPVAVLERLVERMFDGEPDLDDTAENEHGHYDGFTVSATIAAERFAVAAVLYADALVAALNGNPAYQSVAHS